MDGVEPNEMVELSAELGVRDHTDKKLDTIMFQPKTVFRERVWVTPPETKDNGEN